MTIKSKPSSSEYEGRMGADIWQERYVNVLYHIPGSIQSPEMDKMLENSMRITEPDPICRFCGRPRVDPVAPARTCRCFEGA